VGPVVGVEDVRSGRVGKFLVAVVIVVHGDPQLLQIVLAGRPVGGLAHLLDGGDKQPDQDRNDRNHHQQFNQREARASEESLRARRRLAHGRVRLGNEESVGVVRPHPVRRKTWVSADGIAPSPDLQAVTP
jgi:hypothetical protein